MNDEKKYPIGGFAPGNYFCVCVTCGVYFTGDKRAVQCETCAEKSIADLKLLDLGSESI
jgi:hypothetical protein